MEFEVIPGCRLEEAQISAWSKIQAGNAELERPFFSPQFTQAVAAVRDDVQVAILREEGNAVGFFPFQRDWMGIARPVGHKVSDFQGVICEARASWDAMDLIRGAGIKAFEFDHLLTSQAPFAPYFGRCGNSPLIDLSMGFEAYCAQRRESGSEQIKKLRNLERKMEREAGPLRFEAHVEDDRVLEALIHLKQTQYGEKGYKDVLAESWIARLIRLLHQTQGEEFAGVLSALYAGEKLAAVHMGLRSRTVWHYWFPTYDPAFGKYSAGLILLLRMAQAASEMGIRVIDLGKGESDYKQRFMNGSILLAAGQVARPSVAVSMRNGLKHARRWIRPTLVGPAAAAWRKWMGHAA